MHLHAILFILILFATLIGELRFRSRFSHWTLAADKRHYPLKFMLSPFLQLDASFPGMASGVRRSQVMQKVGALYGKRGIEIPLRLHWASRYAHAVVGLAAGCMLAMTGGDKPDMIWYPAAGGIGCFLLYDAHLDSLLRDRHMALRLAFPDYVSKLTLLVQAGLQVRQAIERIASEDDGNVLNHEFIRLLADLESGMPDEEAWQHLNDRCRLPEILRFTGMLTFHLRMGGAGLVRELRQIGADSWEGRRQAARQLGETASSKMVAPLSLMFIAILMAVAAPALLSIGLF